jgi:hypothetical protein
MNYTSNPKMVRVDFFKPSGKWYTTEAVEFGIEDEDLNRRFLDALKLHLRRPDGQLRLAGMWAVCLEPYSDHPFPLMVQIP